MESETFWGLSSLLLIIAFVSYSFYQGSKVKRPPHNVPVNTVDITSADDFR